MDAGYLEVLYGEVGDSGGVGVKIAEVRAEVSVEMSAEVEAE